MPNAYFRAALGLYFIGSHRRVGRSKRDLLSGCFGQVFGNQALSKDLARAVMRY